MSNTLSKEQAPDGMKWQQICHDDSCPPYDSYCSYCSRSMACDSEDKRLVKLSEPDSMHIDQIKSQDELAEKLKQEAIGFEIWKNREGWMFSSNPLWEPNVRVYFQPNEETDWLSLEELYNLYKQSKEKQP